MELFQSSGDWWNPDSPEERVSGEVSFTPDDGITLDLNGNLPFKEEELGRISRSKLSKEYPILYGDLGQDGPVTLQKVTMTSAHFGGYSESEEYIASGMVVGDHLPQNPSFVRADFIVDEIPDWTGDSTVRPVIDRESVEQVIDTEDIEAVFAATDSKEYTAEFEELEVKILNYSRISSGVNSAEMETVGVLRVVPNDEVSLSTLFDYGSGALEYLSFAVGTGIHPDEIKLYTDLEEQPLDAYYTLLDYTRDRSASIANYLFRPDYADFETTFQNWVEHREKASEVHQNYKLLIHSSNLSPRLRFLTTVIALEAYYDAEYQDETYIPEEEFDEIQSEILQLVPNDTELQGQIYGLLENVANTPSIKDKLIKLMESENEIIEVFFEISNLASEARTQRNSVAHGSSKASPTEFYILSKKLQLVLEALLARKLECQKRTFPMLWQPDTRTL